MTRYIFEDITACNMCGADAGSFEMLGLRLNQSQGRAPRKTRGVAVSIDKCTKCGLIFPNPMPVPESILDHYGMPAEDYWKDERAKPQVSPVAVKRFTRLRNMIPTEGRPKGLEVGAGSGQRLLVMEEAGMDAYGFEPIPQFLEVAKRVSGIAEDRLQQAGIDEAEYPDESFDFISFSAVLEHLYDPGGSIAKVLKWLKPNGLVYAEIPSSRHMIAGMIDKLMRLRGTNLVTHTSPMHNPFHLYEFEEESFRAHGRRNGYELADVEYEVCSIRHVPGALHPLFRFVMDKRKTGMQLHVALRKLPA